MNLAYWLKKTPKPVAVMADDKRIEIPRNARAWKDLTATITALEPSKLTCLDGQGNVIRSVVLDTETEQEAPAEPEDEPSLQLFARLLADGYRHGMSANQPIVDSAMQFIERQGQRLAKAEAEIERLRAQLYKQSLQIAELTSVPAPAADESSLMGSLLAGALQANAQAAVSQQVTPINAAAKGPKK